MVRRMFGRPFTGAHAVKQSQSEEYVLRGIIGVCEDDLLGLARSARAALRGL